MVKAAVLLISLTLPLSGCGHFHMQTEYIGDTEEMRMTDLIKLEINGHVLSAELADNSSAKALLSLLAEGPLTIAMRDYGNMEKTGELGVDLPRNDELITTEPGDLILYLGSTFVIYYGHNKWRLTMLGKIRGISQYELKSILGDGDVSVIVSL